MSSEQLPKGDLEELADALQEIKRDMLELVREFFMIDKIFERLLNLVNKK